MKVFQISLLGLFVLISVVTLICGKVFGMNVFLLMLSNVFFCLINFLIFHLTKEKVSTASQKSIRKIMLSSSLRLFLSMIFIAGIIFYYRDSISISNYVFIGIIYFCYLVIDTLFLAKSKQ